MTPREQALEVIAEIYEAAVQPDRWPQALRKLEAFVGAPQPLLLAPEAAPEHAIALADLPAAQSERMQVLMPHLLRAAEVMRRLREASLKTAGTLAAFEELTCGVLILDESAAVTFRNRAARRMLAEGDGLKLRSSRLMASDAHSQKSFDRALEDCLRTGHDPNAGSRGMRIRRPSNRPDYIVQIAALATRPDLRAEGTPGAAVVFISDPDVVLVVDESLLKRLYGLTPAECRLARLLLNGATLASAALELGISEATAKTELQHTFQKTGTHRQAELIKLMVSVSSTTMT